MDIKEAVMARHSVRSYDTRAIEQEKIDRLKQLVDEFNNESGMHIQLITDEPAAFGQSRMAHYGKFSGISNYFAMVGKKGKKLDESLGYYGEKLVIAAQTMGLSTCWVGLTYKKVGEAIAIDSDEKLVCVIALGYAASDGVAHKSKAPQDVSATPLSDAPQWYRDGIDYALLAPTAMNQQKFKFELLPDNKVRARASWGFYSKVDLGIVKYHFELGAGTNNFNWTE